MVILYDDVEFLGVLLIGEYYFDSTSSISFLNGYYYLSYCSPLSTFVPIFYYYLNHYIIT